MFSPRAAIWYLFAAVAIVLAVILLFQRYVRKDDKLVRQGSATLLFAGCLVLFAFFAILAGVVSVQVGAS